VLLRSWAFLVHWKKVACGAFFGHQLRFRRLRAPGKKHGFAACRLASLRPATSEKNPAGAGFFAAGAG
jgi:hypothetical protein